MTADRLCCQNGCSEVPTAHVRKQNDMIEYEERDSVLLAIGFASYAEYLNSRKWAQIRNRVLTKRGKCACCGEPATEVHHKDYRQETMIGADISGLVPVCSACHDIAEFNSDGSKATLAAANRSIDMLSSLDSISLPAQQRPWREVKADSLQDVRELRVLKTPSHLNKRKMIRDKIPQELLIQVEKKTVKKPEPIGRSYRLLMPPLPRP